MGARRQERFVEDGDTGLHDNDIDEWYESLKADAAAGEQPSEADIDKAHDAGLYSYPKEGHDGD